MIGFSRRSKIITLAILLVLSCIIAVPVFAEDGSGDGSGGGQGVPLGLASSTPADGAKNVSLDSDIKLTFNKNVIYLTLRENNKKCFSLVSQDGSKVPIEVIMADDQIHPEEKRNIGIDPLEQFKPGTAYTLKISPDLQAKNGTSLDREVTVSFVTAGTAVKPAPVAPASEIVSPNKEAKPAPAAENGAVENETPASLDSKKDAALTEQKTSGVENTKVAQDKQVKNEEKTPVKEEHQDEPKPNRTYAIIAGVVLLAGAGYLQARKRK